MSNKNQLGRLPNTLTPTLKSNPNVLPKPTGNRTQLNITPNKQQIPTSVKTTKINHYRESNPSQTAGINKQHTTPARSSATSTLAIAIAPANDSDTEITTNIMNSATATSTDEQYVNTHTHTTQTPGTSSNFSNRNFASITANYNSPKRDQALVFNSIDGVPQKEYILAVGQIVSPKNITFVSRISNNRFCIFLSNKNTLDALMEKTKIIIINDQEIQLRRLINPAKRIIISNVCPSIPNQEILNALKDVDVIPTSQINYIKAGINIEGYEHILSFRRQMYIKHEDTNKLPGSIAINFNGSQFRIFLTDDSITCYTCKSSGHTSKTCKKDILNESCTQYVDNHYPKLLQDSQSKVVTEREDHSPPPQLSQIFDTSDGGTPMDRPRDENLSMDTINPSSPPTGTNSPDEKIMDSTLENADLVSNLPKHNLPSIVINETNEKNKRPLSETSSSQKSLTTINSETSPTATNKPVIKKPKINSRSNSFSLTEESILETPLKPAQEIFLNTNNNPLSISQFQYLIENFTNKSINIHSLCKQVNSDIPSIINIIDKVRPKITDRALKTKLTKLSNLLFQSLPPHEDN